MKLHQNYSRTAITAVVTIAALIAGCRGGSKNTKTDSAIVADRDTSHHTPSIQRPYAAISGEYILTFSQDTGGHGFNKIRKFSAPAALTKANLQSTLQKLHAAFTYLKIRVAELRRISKYRMVLKLDSGRLRLARLDPRFRQVDTNYVISHPFGIQVGHRRKSNFLAAAKNYGIDLIMNAPRQDINSAKKVWLIDGGVDKDHQDLNIDQALSRSFVDKYSYFEMTGKFSYHGTHVAGIIGARRDHGMMIGVAPNAAIVVLKVVQNDTIPSYASYLDALQTVLDQGKPGDVLNLSIEHTPGKAQERDLITRIGAKGIFVVIAAGNDDQDIIQAAIYPAAFTGKNIFTVASCGSGKKFSGFSNYGKPNIIYYAPGEDIYSTIPGNDYDYDSGTSQAAPQVAGLLFLGVNVRSAFTSICAGDQKTYSLVHE